MPDLVMGHRVMERVRSDFSEGQKSSNKRYTTDLEGKIAAETVKAEHRNTQSETSGYYLYQIQNSFHESGAVGSARYARSLLELEAEVRSGNCGEMSDVAAFYANEHEHVPAPHIYIGVITAPGQHVFCLISDAPIPAPLRVANTVFNFCRAQPAHMIIDPWLNTACLTRHYVAETKVRLTKWQTEGKRISWGGPDGTRKGWYPPAGEYKAAMQRAPVTLYPYA